MAEFKIRRLPSVPSVVRVMTKRATAAAVEAVLKVPDQSASDPAGGTTLRFTARQRAFLEAFASEWHTSLQVVAGVLLDGLIEQTLSDHSGD